jgi:hypothetical protein
MNMTLMAFTQNRIFKVQGKFVAAFDECGTRTFMKICDMYVLDKFLHMSDIRYA